MDIEKHIYQYMDKRHPNERYTSFDYCYNYFYSFYKNNRIPELADKDNIQMSCLQLGFYLASWGMYRGSTFILKKSLKHLENLIIAISEKESIFWEIDVHNYNEKNIELIMDYRGEIINALGKDNQKNWDTLVTKIMLGVFGNVPAFDTFFTESRLRVKTFNKNSLIELKHFYDKNKSIFDNIKICTLDYTTCEETNVLYTKAKLVDMCGFIDGKNNIDHII